MSLEGLFVSLAAIPSQSVLLAQNLAPSNERLAGFHVVWLLVVLLLLAFGPRACEATWRRWTLACCTGLAAVYGPFVIMVANTWVFDGYNEYLNSSASGGGSIWPFLFVSPGIMGIDVIGHVLLGRMWPFHGQLPGVVGFLVGLLLCATFVGGTALVAAKMPRTRWGVLPLVDVFFSFCALFLDAGMRI